MRRLNNFIDIVRKQSRDNAFNEINEHDIHRTESGRPLCRVLKNNYIVLIRKIERWVNNRKATTKILLSL